MNIWSSSSNWGLRRYVRTAMQMKAEILLSGTPSNHPTFELKGFSFLGAVSTPNAISRKPRPFPSGTLQVQNHV